MQFEVTPMFPTPIAKFKLDRDFTNQEMFEFRKAYMDKQENLRNSLSKDKYVLERPVLSKVKKFITTSLNEYGKQVYRAKYTFKITQSWVNMSKVGEFHHEHMHRNSIFSGVLYVNTAKGDGIRFKRGFEQNSFELKYEEWNQFNSPVWSLDANIGELVLFPSFLYHDVPEVLSGERISLAFNSFVVEPLGDIENLTYLKI